MVDPAINNVIVLVATVAGKGEVSPKICPKIKTPTLPTAPEPIPKQLYSAKVSRPLPQHFGPPNWRPQPSQKWGWIPFSLQLHFFNLKQPPIIFSSLELICQTRKLSQIWPQRGAAPEATTFFVWLRWFLPNSSPATHQRRRESFPMTRQWDWYIYLPTFAWLILLYIFGLLVKPTTLLFQG